MSEEAEIEKLAERFKPFMGLAINDKTIAYAKSKKDGQKGFKISLNAAREYYALECAKVAQAYADEQKIEFANDVMNKAFGKNGIKGIPDSNKIAGFILEHLKQD